jgi:hypothetical protein
MTAEKEASISGRWTGWSKSQERRYRKGLALVVAEAKKRHYCPTRRTRDASADDGAGVSWEMSTSARGGSQGRSPYLRSTAPMSSAPEFLARPKKSSWTAQDCPASMA